MPNDTTLRARIHAALASSTPPALDLAAVHYRAENPVRTVKAAPRKGRIAAIALAIAIPAVAFAATPQSLIRATMHHLAIAYFGATAANNLAQALPNAGQQQRMVRIMKTFKGTSTKSVTFINGAIVHPIPLADALQQASHEFHVVLPQHLPGGASSTDAIYAGGTLSYGYRLRGGGVLDVTVKRATKQNSKPARKLGAFTARFSKDGRLLRSARVNIVRFAVADEVIDFQSARLSSAQLAAIGRQMGGREIGSSQ
uniref:Uncharacterized protein n=1 Tax=mine drainage metagenome TaxID=410659 RepID=E6PF42_9ZZZZ